MYKIGDKVETPLGIGIIKWIDKASHNEDEGYDTMYVSFNGFPEIEINERHIKPYRTAHDKLIEMGWEISECKEVKLYQKNGDFIEFNVGQKTYTIYSLGNQDVIIDLELSRILTQYLEELEGKE